MSLHKFGEQRCVSPPTSTFLHVFSSSSERYLAEEPWAPTYNVYTIIHEDRSLCRANRLHPVYIFMRHIFLWIWCRFRPIVCVDFCARYFAVNCKICFIIGQQELGRMPRINILKATRQTTLQFLYEPSEFSIRWCIVSKCKKAVSGRGWFKLNIQHMFGAEFLIITNGWHCLFHMFSCFDKEWALLRSRSRHRDERRRMLRKQSAFILLIISY